MSATIAGLGCGQSVHNVNVHIQHERNLEAPRKSTHRSTHRLTHRFDRSQFDRICDCAMIVSIRPWCTQLNQQHWQVTSSHPHALFPSHLLTIMTTTKHSVYAAHPTLTSFTASRPRGQPVWKRIANDVSVHKRYKRRRGITISDADAYSHLRSIALSRPIVAQASPPSASSLAPALHPSASAAFVPSLDALSVVVDVLVSNTAAGLSRLVAPVSPPPASPTPGLTQPSTPRTPCTPPTPAHNPCCVCRRQPAVVITLPCRDQRLCAECWTAFLAAKKAVHGGKERLRKKLYYGNFVAAPFVPLCPTCGQVVESSFVPFIN